MARKNTPAEELYEVAVLLLVAVKGMKAAMSGRVGPKLNALIRRAEAATKARPK